MIQNKNGFISKSIATQSTLFEMVVVSKLINVKYHECLASIFSFLVDYTTVNLLLLMENDYFLNFQNTVKV